MSENLPGEQTEPTIEELQRKVIWLEERYKLTMKIISDAVANTLPLDLQQALYLDIAKRTHQHKQGEFKLYKRNNKLNRKQNT